MNTWTKTATLSLAALFLFTTSTASPIASAAGPPTHQSSPEDIVHGVVKEKTNKAITLAGGQNREDLKITLTAETIYMKDGKPATLEDVVVGGQVRVTLKHGTRDAIEVKIMPPAESIETSARI